MSTEPFVSIIVPTLNEEKNITKCLRAIFDMNISKDQYEVIVVDNGSKDKTVQIATDFGTKVLIKPDVNISLLRNFGTKEAKGDIFAFIDADCLVTENWLKEALGELENEEVGATGANYKINGKGTWVSRAWELHKKNRTFRSEVGWIQSGNLLIKRRCFESIGGFNERLNVCEDSDICFRIKEKRYKIISNDAICSYHTGDPRTIIEFFRKQLWHGKDVLRLFFMSTNKKLYIKIFLLSIFYMLGILTVLLSLLFGLMNLSILAVAGMILVSFIWAVKTGVEKKGYMHILSLTVLFLTFGIARAICFIDVRNWRK